MSAYLGLVAQGQLPPNHVLINQIQDIFNLVPRINNEEMAKAFAVKTNDRLLVIYLSSLIRSVIALHGLIKNKLENRRLEKEAAKPQKPEGADAKKDEKKDDDEKKEEDDPSKHPNNDVEAAQTG